MLISKLLGRPDRSASRETGPERDPPPLFVVSATRLSEAAFWRDSLLGVSLRRADYVTTLRHRIAFGNTRGLPELYNQAIEAAGDDESLVFVHDDVALYDFHLARRVADGLDHFDVIGVAGSAWPSPDNAGWRIRVPVDSDQPTDRPPDGHDPGESGVVNHLYPDREVLSRYGPAPRRVALLDGLLLAARASTLRRHGLGFDERFRFHFYDADFCRSCTARGLKVGTWPIPLGHASPGHYQSPEWRAALADYRAKWGMTAPAV